MVIYLALEKYDKKINEDKLLHNIEMNHQKFIQLTDNTSRSLEEIEDNVDTIEDKEDNKQNFGIFFLIIALINRIFVRIT